MRLRVGQIGIGAWGQFHCKILSELPEVNLVGLYDIKPATGLAFAEIYNTTASESFKSLVGNIDALVVTAPTSEHFEIAKYALLNGVHVFVEKPICASVAQASQLIELSQAKDLVLQVGHIERFNPAFQAIQNQEYMPHYLESYRLAPFSPRGTDVSVVIDLMVHDIDLILKIVNKSVKKIVASGIKVASKNIDFANARVEFENGCIANLTASRVAADKVRQLVFYHGKEQVVLDFMSRMAKKSYVEFSNDQVQNGKSEIELTLSNSSVINPLKQELLAFINAISHEQTPLVNAAEGTEALKIALKIDKYIMDNSAKTVSNAKSPKQS